MEQLLHRSVAEGSEAAKEAGAFLSKPPDLLEKCSQSALELYAGLQKRSKEQRLQAEDNVAMTKVVVKALKYRNQLFTDCFTQIR